MLVFNQCIFFVLNLFIFEERFWSKVLGGLKEHIASVHLVFSGGKRLDKHWQCVFSFYF